MGIPEDALDFVKKNKKSLIEKFCSLDVYPSVENPITIFMAGSPGAGKTEFSKTLVKIFEKRSPDIKVVRIDPDEIRKEIPFYTGENSSEIQRACVTGARNLFYYVSKYGQNFIYDGTMSSFEPARRDVELLVKKGRGVGIFYLHQDPVLSWKLTKKREVLEGRPVPLDFFVKAYFESRTNVNKIKEEFGQSVKLFFLERDVEKKSFKYKINVDKIDSFVKNDYNRVSLKKELKSLNLKGIDHV